MCLWHSVAQMRKEAFTAHTCKIRLRKAWTMHWGRSTFSNWKLLVFIVLGLVDNYCLLKNGEVDCSHLQTGNLRVLSVGLCPFRMAFGRVTEDETMNSHWNSREEVSCSALFLFPCYLSFSILFKTWCLRQWKKLNSSLRASGLRFW